MTAMDDPSIRVSDAEREQAVAALGARVGGDLARVQEDLPAAASAAAARPRRRPARFTAALLGHVARRGRFRLRRWTLAASALGDLDLDLREATIEGPHTAVTALVAFGNADIYVPEGVGVDVSGLTIFGHRREWGHDTGRPDAPVVRVRVFGCFGTVDVWRVPRDMRGSYSEIFRQLEERQRQLPG